MSRTDRSVSNRPRGDKTDALDEVCLLSELRLAVEGARTAAEEQLVRALPEWTDRLNRIRVRYGSPAPA